MSDIERSSRETFYRNMIWVVDGRPFERNFDFYHPLPCPRSELAQDIVWCKAKRHINGSNRGLFYRMSEALRENPNVTKANLSGGLLHGIDEIADEMRFSGYYQYDWVRPRRTWLDATCPVYIDFGNDMLAQLLIYDSSGLPCVRLISRQKLVHDAMHEVDAMNIATRFNPIRTPQE